MKRVLFLTNIPSPYRVDFFNELGKYVQLEVVYELASATDRDKKWQEEKANSFMEVILQGIRINADSAICLGILRKIAKNKYDVIIVGGYSTPTAILAILYMWIFRIPFVLNADGGIVKQERKIKYLIKRFLISRAQWWLSTGSATNEYLIHYGAKKEAIFEYPFSSFREKDILNAPINKEKKDIQKQELSVKEKKVILFIGQFIYRKGIDVLLYACEGLDDDIGVYIVGGTETDEYQKIINEKNLRNIHFVEFVNKETIKKYYMAADLFVLPTREDIWGLVINEAMSYGLPVITTDKCIAGIELMGKDSDRIIPANNAKLLHRALKCYLEIDTELFFYENYQVISNYTIENMAKIHAEIIEKIGN